MLHIRKRIILVWYLTVCLTIIITKTALSRESKIFYSAKRCKELLYLSKMSFSDTTINGQIKIFSIVMRKETDSVLSDWHSSAHFRVARLFRASRCSVKCRQSCTSSEAFAVSDREVLYCGVSAGTQWIRRHECCIRAGYSEHQR